MPRSGREWVPKPALWVAAVCAGINLGVGALVMTHRPDYLAESRLAQSPDAPVYLRVGRNLLLRGYFSRCQQAPFAPDLGLTPVYPVFVGVLDAAGGAGAIYAAQAVLHAASCVLLFLLARRVFGPAPAFWAALLLATDPLLVIYNFQPMSETLFVFLMLAALVLVVPALVSTRGSPRRVGGRIVIGGFLFGLAILTRPAGLHLPFVLAVACLAVSWPRERRVALLVRGGLLLAVCFAPVGAWIVRNAVVFSTPVLSRTQSIMLVYFTGAGAYQLRHGVSQAEAQAMIAAEFGLPPCTEVHNPEQFGRDPAEIEAALRPVVWPVLTKYPWHLVMSSAIGVVKASTAHSTGELAYMLGREWIAPGSRALVSQPREAAGRLWSNGPLLSLVFLWQMLHVVVALGLALVGVAATMRKRELRPLGIALLVAMAYLYLTIAIAGCEAVGRYRIPVLPLVHLFAGYGVYRLTQVRAKTVVIPAHPVEHPAR